MIPKDTGTNASIKAILKNLTQTDFKTFGLQHMAYIKAEKGDIRTVYSIHAADGSKLSVMDSMQEAAVATRMNDLEPMTLH